MTEPSIQAFVRPDGPLVTPRPDVAGAEPQEAIREALSCLTTADRRLRKHSAPDVDAALVLLQTAAAHLQQALDPQG